jgi:hypothetical protein
MYYLERISWMRRLLTAGLALSLFSFVADAKPKPRGTRPVQSHHAHEAVPHSPHAATHPPVTKHDLAYTPKKNKHFKLGKP